MKNAGIITHYDVHNHGAHLQLYALRQVLNKLGYEAKALQFQKNYDFMGGAQVGNKYNISVKSIPIYAKYLLKNGAGRTLYNYKKHKILSKFRNRENVIGEYYSKANNLDVVVIGSDEIFSIEAGPNPWYYGIGIPCKMEISYAASFGPTTLSMIDQHNMAALVGAGLSNLNSIAVRDRNSASIVRHFTGKDAKIVCDPVLLYDFPRQLKKNVIEEFKKTLKDRYCIVYSYDYNMNDLETVEHIREFARKRNLKIYSVAYFHKWCDKNINLAPLDVFKWFACSEMVFTDTFHGSVISLATGVQFISKIRGNENKLFFLLEQYGVSQRICNDFTNIDKISQDPIDYNVVDNIIKKIRNQSMDYLRNALKVEG